MSNIGFFGFSRFIDRSIAIVLVSMGMICTRPDSHILTSSEVARREHGAVRKRIFSSADGRR
jgi:hypothetical protein